MDGDVESAAKGEVQGTLAPADAASAEVDVIVRARRAVGDEAQLRMPELAKALIDAVLHGNMSAAKLLFDVLDQLAEDRKSQTVVVARSIAEEWGVEPEWSSDRCIHCATAIGDEGDAG
ncbi:MAG: hypothetical protein WBF42_04915 [Terracidiphilus sp.]